MIYYTQFTTTNHQFILLTTSDSASFSYYGNYFINAAQVYKVLEYRIMATGMNSLDDDEEDFLNMFGGGEEDQDLLTTLNAVFDNIDIPEGATSAEELNIYNKEVNSVIMKLQYQMEEMSVKAEETMQDIVLSIPALNRSMSKIEREAEQLKKELGKVIEEISTLEKNSGDGEEDDVIDQLLRLDIVKKNITEVSTKLTKSASWDQNIRLMDEALNAGDLHKAAEQYQILRNSINLLKDLPHAEEREQVLSSLQRSLQKQLSPRVEMVLADESSENFDYYVKVYDTLGGQDDLINMYSNNISKNLKSKWDIYDPNADKDFLSWLQSFYEAIIASLYVETRRCLKYFPAVILSIFNQILRGVFVSIEDSFNERLDSTIFTIGDFVNTYRITTSFISAIETLLISVMERLKLDKKNYSIKISELAAMDIELESSLLYIFKPFEEKFHQYESLVLEDLKLKIQAIFVKRNVTTDLKTSWDILQYLREIEGIMPQIISTIDRLLDVSLDITHGTIVENFANAVGDMMKNILSLQNNIRDEVRRMVRLDDIFNTNNKIDSKSQKSNNNSNNKSLSHTTSPEHRFWGVLEVCIRLVSFNCKIKGEWNHYHSDSHKKILERIQFIIDITNNKINSRRVIGKKSKQEIESDKNVSAKVNGRYLKESKDAMINISEGLAILRLRGNVALNGSLNTFAGKLEKNEVQPFSNVVSYIDNCIVRTLRLMYEITIAPIKYHLSQVSKYKLWGKLKEENDVRGNDMFGTSSMAGWSDDVGLGGPLEYATLIGESLLSLVQRLEQFNDFQPLQEGAISFENVQNLMKNDWEKLIQELGINNNELFEDTNNESWNDFSKTWVAVSASGAMALFVNSILSIRFISDIGAKQLVVDISYMLNVLSALGLKAGKLMIPLKKIFEMNIDELTPLANDDEGMMGNDNKSTVEGINADQGNRKLVKRIAKQRGIMTSSF
jgi:hypothetical protein